MFLEQTNDRRLSPDYTGDVLIFDIDKTYLDTSFSSFRGLLAIPFELAVDKTALPGAVPVIRALRHGPDEKTALTPLYFVSGSPPELRKVVEQKMTLDGVEFDGITFKDQWGLLKAGRPRDIKAQVGYKLKALLRYRRELPHGARYLMFGDDVEEDAGVFALFGETCRELRGRALEQRLRSSRVSKDDVAEILELAEAIPTGVDPVDRIFIHLSHGADPARFAERRDVIATRSYLQTAMVLLEMRKVRPETVAAAAKDLRRRRTSEHDIAAEIHDAEVRLRISRETLTRARP